FDVDGVESSRHSYVLEVGVAHSGCAQRVCQGRRSSRVTESAVTRATHWPFTGGLESALSICGPAAMIARTQRKTVGPKLPFHLGGACLDGVREHRTGRPETGG